MVCRYYPERVDHGECTGVNRRLEEAVRSALSVPTPGNSSSTKMAVGDVQRMLRQWSHWQFIKDKFTADNAHLTVPRGCSGGGNFGDVLRLATLQRTLSANMARTDAAEST